MPFTPHYLFCTPPLPATAGGQGHGILSLNGQKDDDRRRLSAKRHQQHAHYQAATLKTDRSTTFSSSSSSSPSPDGRDVVGLNVDALTWTTRTRNGARSEMRIGGAAREAGIKISRNSNGRPISTKVKGRRKGAENEIEAQNEKETSSNNYFLKTAVKGKLTMTGTISDDEGEEQMKRVRRHRCSRCGAEGHNVRVCPMSKWFEQRCGLCGMVGHNARNCTGAVATAICRVCAGAGRLPCSKCNGSNGSRKSGGAFDRGVYARRARSFSGPASGGGESAGAQLIVGPSLTKEQKRMADVVRRRVGRQRKVKAEEGGEDDDQLIGGGGGATAVKIRSRLGQSAAKTGDDEEELVGGATGADGGGGAGKRCERCMGTGYLTCMACTD